MANPWMQTFSHLHVVPLALQPEDVKIEDIAHALSNQCRFYGQCDPVYSVAEHCVRMTVLVSGGDAKLLALLHDAAEQYLSDILRPWKGSILFRDLDGKLKTFDEIEKRLLNVILPALGIDHPVGEDRDWNLVKRADAAMLWRECKDVMHEDPTDWGLETPEQGIRPKGVIIPWTHKKAKKRFLAKYSELKKQYDARTARKTECYG